VEPDKTSKPCDSLLNAPRSHFTSKPRWQGKALWKKSRHQLLIGNKETSNVLMCQAALVDPVGKASVGLGNYYLSLRSLDEAKSWAEYGIEHRGKHARTSKELLGDVLSQMGDVEGAKRMWLETMQVESDDVITLRTVSRSLTRNASQARQGGDHPLAERLLRRAVLLDEENADAASLLAASLFKNAQAGLAERWAKHALKLDAASGYALLTLGDLAAQAGEPEKARTYYQKIPEQSSASEKVDERLETL
jgi:tetratricopeptide (TPR) repeat protein